MAIKIEKQFELDAPIDRVWAFMTDPYRVVSCLPGAAITEKLDERTYSGTITVKVGPVTVNYKGKAQFERVDPATHEAELRGRAQDVKGKGSAAGRLVTRLLALDKKRTQVTVVSEVALIGPLAQFGDACCKTWRTRSSNSQPFLCSTSCRPTSSRRSLQGGNLRLRRSMRFRSRSKCSGARSSGCSAGSSG